MPSVPPTPTGQQVFTPLVGLDDENFVLQRRTKIVCTIGPACSTPEIIGGMMDAGMNCSRLNFSHGDYETHARMIKIIRSEAKKRGIPFAIMQDLQGPKIRIGKLVDGKPIEVKLGQRIAITTDPSYIGNAQKVSTSYASLVQDAQVGRTLLVDDGLLSFRVIERRLAEQDGKYDEAVLETLVGGLLKEHKGINLPGSAISAPAMTEKDKHDLLFGLKQNVDYVCLSFVRAAEDIQQCRAIIRENSGGRPISIIAKIERQEAIDNIDEILRACDGIMVARGDLGVEVPYYELPVLQKQLIARSSELGKLDITATQMLASMEYTARPTRAEITDVQNAVFDGTDVVMTSNETATGIAPIEAVRTMAQIAAFADLNSTDFARKPNYSTVESEERRENTTATNICKSTALAAATVAQRYKDVKLVACVTRSGTSAMELSQHRTNQRVVALTQSEDTFNKLALVWGVTPVLIPNLFEVGVAKVEDLVVRTLLQQKFITSGDIICLLLGSATVEGVSNTLRIVVVP